MWIPRYIVDERLGGPLRRFGHNGRKESHFLSGVEPGLLGRPDRA
jgi:hypothetical protein